jgi:hypothetical protein
VARTWNTIENAQFGQQHYRLALAVYQKAVACGNVGVHLAPADFGLGQTYLACPGQDLTISH